MKDNKLRNMLLAGVMVAVTAVCSQISLMLPTGIPMTLQTFAIAMCGSLLGKKWGAISVGVYIFAGLAGMPVFSVLNGSGPSVLIGLTGGFIWGFVFLAFFCGLGAEQKNKMLQVLFPFTGLILCHAAGIIQHILLTDSGPVQSLVSVSLPFIPKDIILVALAMTLSQTIKKRLDLLSV